MRTIIDIPDTQLDLLNIFAIQEKISRAELIRRAVADYLQRYATVAKDDAFGLWQQRGEDGLAYQQRLREEWD
jgi:metal-responsive CopG/Arc/MetJ family transcriptional regulator